MAAKNDAMTEIPLLLLHGALGSAPQFAPLFSHLPSEWQMNAPDFPGHGSTADDDTPYSMERFSMFISDYLDEHKILTANIFGYSMGGYAALYFAWKNPERVGRIFTLGTKFDWTPDTAAKEAAMLDPEKIEAKVPAFAQNLALRHGNGNWKAVLHRSSELLRNLGAGRGIPPGAFARIDCPVTIGLGEMDNMVGHEESRNVAEALPNGRFDHLPGCKHPIEQVDFVLLAERLKEFFC